MDIDNVEDLFAYFESAKLLGRLGDIPEDAVNNLPRNLRHVITRTLEQSIQFPIMDDDGIVGSPYPYAAFLELLRQVQRSRALSPAAVITFNYDLALDYADSVSSQTIDYMLPADASRPSNTDDPPLVVLKPHGSLNWEREPTTGHIVPRNIRVLHSQAYRHRLGIWGDVRTTCTDTMELIHGPDAWGERVVPEPVIVPPSWNKSDRYDELRSVWRYASDVVSTVENIFVIGYSLPPSDHFFRAFFALSTVSDTVIDKFWVFDPADVSARFERLVGPAVLERQRFRHERSTLDDAILFLGRTLQLDEDPIVNELTRYRKYL